jgi:hypothetical protein
MAGLHVGNWDKAMTDASEYENDIDELQENSFTHNSWIIDITRSFNLYELSLFLYG